MAKDARDRMLSGVHVLLVDDDEEMLDALEAMLGAAGAHVTTATEPSEAIAILTAVRPHVIVTALAFPSRHDGRWLLNEVRRHPQWETICVVAVVNESTRNIPRDVPFDAVLTKPVDGEQFVAVIRGVLASDARR